MITKSLAAYLIVAMQLMSQGNSGTLKGMISDRGNKLGLQSATISIEKTSFGAVADENGQFVITHLPVGNYTAKIEYIGYSSVLKTDILIRPNRITSLNIELKERADHSDEVVVTARFFEETLEKPISTIQFSHEEIRRAPGSAGDVSRIIMGLPSIAKVNDQKNSLIVRGGSPIENAFYVDNIEIPNINHFPTQGASGGPIGLINVDLIKNVNFYSGGFSSIYGDRLSSVMELSFREGNRDEFDGQLDLNFTGFGGMFEGPIANKGSWLFSARKSYIDILAKNIDLGTTVAPEYSDYQGKIVLDLSDSQQLTAIGIFGDDHNNPDLETAIENDMISFGNQDIYENTLGVNLRTLWGISGYSNTSLSYTSTKFIEDSKTTNTNTKLHKNHSTNEFINIRNVNHFELKNGSYEFGFEAKFKRFDFDNIYYSSTDILGNTTPELKLNKRFTDSKYAAFFQFNGFISDRLSYGFGGRASYSKKSEQAHLSPRAHLAYKVDDLTNVKISGGTFYQSLPEVLLATDEANYTLNDPKSVHYILGVDHLLSDDTKLNVETYFKEYFNFPVDPNQNSLFVLDELFYSNGFFFGHSNLEDDGRAQAYGLEISIQKKLAEKFYGMTSLSFSKTKYKLADGIWKNRVFDNQFAFNLEGGYKPNSTWEFSIRWIYAGGTPTTPIDVTQSRITNSTVFDDSEINTIRYNDYHSLNIRFDRRFNYEHSNLVFYLSVWNAYNQKNVASKFWNGDTQKVETIYQWSTLPIFGLEYEF